MELTLGIGQASGVRGVAESAFVYKAVCAERGEGELQAYRVSRPRRLLRLLLCGRFRGRLDTAHFGLCLCIRGEGSEGQVMRMGVGERVLGV